MFERVLKTRRERVRTRHYPMTVHAEEETDADGLSNAILSGRIVERQVDRAWRYRECAIRHCPLECDDSVVGVARLGPTGASPAGTSSDDGEG